MSDIRVLFVGDSVHGEFQLALQWLGKHANLEVVVDLQSARRRLKQSGELKDLLVLGATRPGQFSIEDINALRNASPLLRIVAILGSWCEGELRSGHPWPGVFRTYWHQWPARLALEFKAFLQGACPQWGDPVTMTPAEQLLQRENFHCINTLRLVLIRAEDWETAGALQDACQQAAYATACWVDGEPPRVTGAHVFLWDLADPQRVTQNQVQEYLRVFHPTPIIALASFPRHHTVRRLTAAGVSGVVSKPFLLHDVQWLLEQSGIEAERGNHGKAA